MKESTGRLYRISDPPDPIYRMEDVECTGTGHDKCGRILLWNGPRTGGWDMAVRGKKAAVSGRGIGNGHGDDRYSLCDAVFPVPEV